MVFMKAASSPIYKWANYTSSTILWCERVAQPLPHTNVVLAVALTRQQPSLAITARILDKGDPNQVLFAHSYVDTAASDPSLTEAQVQALPGMQIAGLAPNVAEPPPTEVAALLGLVQYTDGQQPVPTAVYENFELRTWEIPLVGIERAVRLSWASLVCASATVTIMRPLCQPCHKTAIALPTGVSAALWHLGQYQRPGVHDKTSEPPSMARWSRLHSDQGAGGDCYHRAAAGAALARAVPRQNEG
jgi:hypothetical protein